MLSAWALGTEERVANDFKETTMLMRRMPKGRAAPSWSLPTELFLMLLGPMRGVKEDKQAGLGHECVELKTHVFRERMKSILSVTRRAGVTPLAAHRSSPCLLRKKYGVGGGTTSTRMIHLLCHFWRAFYRNLKCRGRKWSPPPQLHGFVKGRRGEGAMATQMVLSARLRKLDKSHMRVFFDGTNAPASTSREVLIEQVDDLLLEEDRGLMGERRANSMIYMDLQGEDRPLRVVPKCGALMGDSNWRGGCRRGD